MDNVLIVSCSEHTAGFFSEALNAAFSYNITIVQSCDAARRLLAATDYDLVIINAPLRDETGEIFSIQTASKGISQVILAVNSEFFEAVSAICERDGVLTLSKPVNMTLFWSSVSLARTAQNRIKKMQAENAELRQKIKDIRIVDRAKCLLISYLKMSETEAHRFIEKKAMDTRSPKRIVAEKIIKKYES